MAENTGIGWTDHTHNFWWECHRFNAECRHCYVAGIMKRAGQVPFDGPIKKKLGDPAEVESASQ